jgi:hypothetical protein
MIANISVLVRHNTPIAWKVSGQPVSAFYSDMDSGDISRQWMAFSRHLLAKCSGNNGFGILDVSNAVVHRGRPILWVEADFKKIHPVEVAQEESPGDEIVHRILYPQYVRDMA